MGSVQRGALAALASLALLIVLPAGAVAKAKPKPTSAQLAKSLAGKVQSARTDGARYAAALGIMKAVKLGVYDATKGKAVVKGLDTNKYDAYLFSGEVREVAASSAKEPTSTAQLAGYLAALFKDGDRVFTTQAVNELVAALVKVSLAHPKAASSLVPLLVRNLGLARHPKVDLAKAAGAQPVALDTLQLTLLEAYLLYPIAHRGSQKIHQVARRPAGHRDSPCAIAKYALNTFSPNAYLDSEAQMHFVGDMAISAVAGAAVGHLTQAFGLTRTGAALDVAGLVGTVISGLHGSLVAEAMELKTSPYTQATAYGNSGLPSAGQGMTFRVEARYHDVLDEDTRACLGAMGLELPQGKPIAGTDYFAISDMDVSWFEEDLSGKGLEDHGTRAFEPEGTFADGQTNAQGVSTLKFTPKSEVLPLGETKTETGREVPRALWGFKFQNPLGAITQLFLPKLGTAMSWTIQYHTQRAQLEADFDITWDVEGAFLGGLFGMYGKDHGTLHTKATVPIDVEDGQPKGEGPWTVMSYESAGTYSALGNSCATHSSNAEPTAPVRVIPAFPAAANEITLLVDPGDVRLLETSSCDEDGGTSESSSLRTLWGELFGDEIVGDAGFYQVQLKPNAQSPGAPTWTTGPVTRTRTGDLLGLHGTETGTRTLVLRSR